VLVAFTARRWRNADPDADGPAMDPDDERRLNADLAAFDR
jgi:hypothetical protein